MLTAPSRFRAYARTASLLTAIDRARAYKALVGFCFLDGLYYVIDPEDWEAAPMTREAIPVPWLAKEPVR